ncbi:MAG: hypothetical protein HUJ26_00195 [Planctomycetaceae bacterium]|nr:hypothetical protein [Planctomycetaceae bacterium]
MFNLHEAKKHDHVIALIEAALSNGHIYPWMYEVLAISYELVGRPKKDIERVLLSAVDSSVDFQSTMLSSAYLSRFDNKSPALRMYRQASRHNPVRPEPYILGLRLARELNDVDAIEWAVVGILNYAWNDNYRELHKQALAAYETALKILEEDNNQVRMKELKSAVQDALKRDLVIDVVWNGNSDLDLAVEDPQGAVCDWETTHTVTGGVHVHDGFGPQQENCYERYVCVRAFPGQYLLRVNRVWGNVVAGRVTVKVIKYQGTDHEKSFTKSFTLTGDDDFIAITLEEGRRQKINESLKNNQQSNIGLWRNPFAREQRLGVGPERLTVQQRQVLQQFLGGGQGGSVTGGGSIVGPAAIGFAPTITPIFEGTAMGVGAVISGDRRYVRIGVNATFQKIVDVFNYSLNDGSSLRANGN